MGQTWIMGNSFTRQPILQQMQYLEAQVVELKIEHLQESDARATA